MKKMYQLLLSICTMGFIACSKPPSINIAPIKYQATLYAGSAAGGTGNINGTGSGASFYSPAGVGIDYDGNVIVADLGNKMVKTINTSYVVSTFAGSGNTQTTYYTLTAAATASFKNPSGVAISSVVGSQVVYISDTGFNGIDAIIGGYTTTYFGETATGLAGSATGLSSLYPGASAAQLARFSGPADLKWSDYWNQLFVVDTQNSQVRIINPSSPWSATTGSSVSFVGMGSGFTGATNASGLSASFNKPKGIAVSPVFPYYVYIADSSNNLIRQVYLQNSNAVTTFAGGGGGIATGFVDGWGTSALFNNPTGMAVDSSGNVYVCDTGNNALRLITPSGLVSTIGVDNSNYIYQPQYITIDSSGNLFITNNKHQVIKLTPLPAEDY